MKTTIAAIALATTFALTPVHSEELQVVSLDAVEQALENSNIKGKEVMDKFAADLAAGVSELFSLFVSAKD